MKKSNVILIAAVLIAIHGLIALALVNSGKKKSRERRPAPASVAQSAAAPEPITLPQPKLNVPLPAAAPIAKPMPVEKTMPVERVALPPVQPRETIASPGTRPGYLRVDRPNKRTTKAYSKLVGNPYQSAIVVDARTGKILFEDRATVYSYPASITKLMTMLLVLEQIDAGRISLNDKVAISKEVVRMGGSGIYLDTRESGAFTVKDMLNALMIHSANDAATALAIHTAGSRAAFVDMMNQKARELGMNSTVYHSENGLPPTDGSQADISTAYDIAILSLAALRHRETLGYTSTKLTYLPLSPIRKEHFMLANRNALVGKAPYPGCDGLKTGYHGMGGWSLAATAKHGDRRVVSVILGAPDKTTRNNTTRKLLDNGFQALEKR